jgi:hypothetical protein
MSGNKKPLRNVIADNEQIIAKVEEQLRHFRAVAAGILI